MEQTVRFALPFLVPGQAQKEWFHNEALQRIDFLLSAVVEGAPGTVPPSSPPAGACYLVADGAVGDWAGKSGTIAGYGTSGWRFLVPADGMTALRRDNGQTIAFRSGVWETGVLRAAEVRVGDKAVLCQRQPAIADPAGGASVDPEGRAAISAVLAAMRAHGLIEV